MLEIQRLKKCIFLSQNRKFWLFSLLLPHPQQVTNTTVLSTKNLAFRRGALSPYLHMSKIYTTFAILSPIFVLNHEVDILIEESRAHIAQMLGHAEEIKSAAMHEQRLLEALCQAKDELNDYKRRYEAQTISLCPYINIEGVQQTGIWQPEQLENKLREACEQDSKTLANFLKENEKKGYLDFHGDSKTKILENLRAHFPSMRQYGYNTFATYF